MLSTSLMHALRRVAVPIVRGSNNRIKFTQILVAVNNLSSDGKSKLSETVLQRVRQFSEREGRQPRILISRLGDTDKKGDEHRMIAATAFADLGFDVDVGPIVQTPEQVARQAVDADVHAIGARNLLMKHMTLIPDLFNQLKQLDRSDILVIVADTIPEEDHKKLYDLGVAAIFSPKSDVSKCAEKILDSIEKAIKQQQCGGQ